MADEPGPQDLPRRAQMFPKSLSHSTAASRNLCNLKKLMGMNAQILGNFCGEDTTLSRTCPHLSSHKIPF